MKRRVRHIFLFASLLFLTVYLPLSAVMYSTFWYSLNCRLHPRCASMDEARTREGINQLVSYYRHRPPGLSGSFWTFKEKQHLAEVRGMTDGFFFIGLTALVLFCVCFDRFGVWHFSRINILIMAGLVFILPVFPYFWRHVFHPLLFSNRNWLNTPCDYSYYILPRMFFRNTLIYLILSSCALNLLAMAMAWPQRVRKHTICPDREEIRGE